MNLFEQYNRQATAAEEMMAEYGAYAVSIGCTLVHDSILATAEQAALLEAKWKELSA